jgi:hypothetical protein
MSSYEFLPSLWSSPLNPSKETMHAQHKEILSPFWIPESRFNEEPVTDNCRCQLTAEILIAAFFFQYGWMKLAYMITDVIYLSGSCYNLEALTYTGKSNKNLKNDSPANLVQLGLAFLNILLDAPHTVHPCNPCSWLAVLAAIHSRVSTQSTCF